MTHLIFYDPHCQFCCTWVDILLRLDKQKIFRFAALDGKTSAHVLKEHLRKMNTLVLIENFQKKEYYWIRAKAVFRIFFLLGGYWKCLGMLSYLPSYLIDPFYRLIALLRNRSHTQLAIQKDERFLP